ncbi:extracellular solute-binding protein [Acinetobacter sp. MD2(2019)]|uniref:extracellular solute-binding protein n=1 Tax=Acinetobacter sp. MD2(2019) TaxID=2605273 RepID=UPI002D1F6328|nr:extracellular solute-binding protein [Acinetobacter sp. MD2(2019)]MEB3753740.1 ABC transporter substrate-binding protein [Acinetobacter sp. MD2(2019)]
MKIWGVVTAGWLLFSSVTTAKVITTPYIALDGSARYSHLSAMPYANPKAVKGGYLIRASIGTFNNLNSMNGLGSSTEGVNLLFDSLMSKSLDEPNVFYPLVAKAVSFDPKQLDSVIFHLNPKAHFSNGQPLTSNDVKFSFDTYQTQSNFGLQMYLSDLAKTEVVDKYSVKFYFKSAHHPEMLAILATLPLYSRMDWQHKDFKRVSLLPILGSGPYLIEHIDAGRSIRYKRNPNYWGKDLAVNRGRYNFNQLQYNYYRNLDVAFEAFKAGEYTLQQENNASRWATAYHFPALSQAKVVKYSFSHQNPISSPAIVFNTRRAPLNDIYLRQAMTYAYDFEWQNKALYYGQYRRLESYFANSELAAKGKPSPAELKLLQPWLAKLNPVMRQGVLSDLHYPVSDATGFNRKNLILAQQLLYKADYRIQHGQLFDVTGKAVKFEFLLNSNDPSTMLISFVRNLKKLGIQVNLRQVDMPQYLERMRRYDFDLSLNNMPQSLTPAREQMQFWGGQAATQIGNYNYAGIQNPAIDAAISAMLHAKNRAELLVATHVLDRLLRAGYYQILSYGSGEIWYAYWNMYRQPQRRPKLSAGIDYWWSDPTAQAQIQHYLHQH